MKTNQHHPELPLRLPRQMINDIRTQARAANIDVNTWVLNVLVEKLTQKIIYTEQPR